MTAFFYFMPVSSPEIAIHKFIVMEKVVYEKRSQKYYSMIFKLFVVQEIERMEFVLTVTKNILHLRF